MKFIFSKYIIIIIGLTLLQFACQDENKWTALPLKIKKQESFNYSEVISGEIDSTQKANLEAVRKNVAKQNNDLSKKLKNQRSGALSSVYAIIISIKESIIKIYHSIFS